jgi:cellulose synthase/poly-beta-1,6-N-acetylglucosamine synthase-like glycosyltransferase
MGDRIELVLFLIFIISAAIQIFYYYFFYLPVSQYKGPAKRTSRQPVSVIICARNESENLKNFLPSVLEQDYPDFEVIVVNDCSEDKTYEVLGKYLQKYPNLRVSTITKDPKFTHNKKFAQFIGIKAAKNEILLFTDADCKPVSNKWIEGMASGFDEKTSFVLGYGGYLKQKGLLNTYIRFDTVIIAMQYLGLAIKGMPYMGVGRNLAYRRSGFFSSNGFKSHTHLASGDDDLFVNMNALKENTRVEFNTDTHTKSVPSSNLSEWIAQKGRHLTTAPYYKLRDKIILGLEPLSRIIFYSSFIVMLSTSSFRIAVLGIFGIKLITQITVLSLVQKKLEETGLVAYSVIFDIFSPLINGILYFDNKRRTPGKNEWR